MERGPKKRQCEDCKRKKKRCHLDHLIEELPGEENKDEEGETEWKDDLLAPIRRFADWHCLVLVLGSETDLPEVDTKRYDFRHHEKVRFRSRAAVLSVSENENKASTTKQRQQLQAC
jgi:hypothetical protein